MSEFASCASCRQPLEPGDRFCQHCGTPVPAPLPPPPPLPTRFIETRLDPASGPDMEPAGPDRRRVYAWLVAAAVVLIFAVAGLVIALGRGDSGRPDAAPTAVPSTTSAPVVVQSQVPEPQDTTDSGQPDAATGSLLGYATASAPATSPDSKDNEGNPTSYGASNLLDDDPSTAWRMDGSAEGETLTFTFDTERTVDHLGLVNGFAKVDPDGDEDRYPENRRVLAVVWEVGDASFSQTLTDGDRDVQDIRITPTQASTIQLRITAVSRPGTGNVDRTAISDVLIAND